MLDENEKDTSVPNETPVTPESSNESNPEVAVTPEPVVEEAIDASPVADPVVTPEEPVVAEPVPTVEVPIADSTVTPEAVPTEPTSDPNPTVPPTTPPTGESPIAEKPKGNKKVGIIAGIAVCVVAVLAFLANSLLLSDKNIVKKEIKTVFNNAKSIVSDVEKSGLNVDFDKDVVGVTGTFSLSTNYQDETMNFSNLGNYKINYSGAINKKGNEASISASINDSSNDVMKIADYIKDKKSVVDLGDLYDKKISLDIDSEVKDIFGDETLDLKNIERVLDKTSTIINKTITNEQVSSTKEEAEVNGKTGKYKKITYRVKMSSFVGSVCEGFLADKEAISLISETFSAEEDQVKEMFKECINDVKDDESKDEIVVNSYKKGLQVKRIDMIINSYGYSDDPNTVQLSLDKNGNVTNYKLSASGQEYIHGEYDKKNKKFTANSSVTGVDFKLEGQKKNDTLSVTADANVMGVSAKVDFKTTSTTKKDSRNNKTEAKVTVNAGTPIEFGFTNDITLTKNGKVEAIDGSDAVDGNTLSDEEAAVLSQNIMTRINTIMQQFVPGFDLSTLMQTQFQASYPSEYTWDDSDWDDSMWDDSDWELTEDDLFSNFRKY